MAESAVKSAADWVGKLLVEEGKYLWGAEGKVEELRDELLWMQSFLRDADTIQYDDEIVRMWVSQVKEHAFEAEDIIDDFVIKVASVRRQTGWINKLKRYSCILGELVALHQVASGIDSLKMKISMLSPKLEKYGLKTSYGMKTYRAREALSEQVQESIRYAQMEDEKIVGLEQDANEVMVALKTSEPSRGVIAIYGTGGLGKTTLATKVFHDNEIRKHFRGGHAWAYISKQFQLRSVLQEVLINLTFKSIGDFSEKNDTELVSELHVFLKENKCLVVLDDIWSQRAWGVLKLAFTSRGGYSESKVLITTRKEEVAKDADSEALCKPDPLNKVESWELLQKTMGWDQKQGFGSYSDRNTVIVSQKIDLGKEMVSQCNGIPLAIVVLGGILRKKETLDEWKSIHKNINSSLRRGYDHGRSYMEILMQSYDDLPYHLKPCFLHLGNFPEDYEISTKKLYWMWMAEGLATWSRDNSAGAESLKDVVNEYISDLAQDGMVKIVKKTSNGRIKSIRMHDLMRDVCLQKAAAENFLNLIDHHPNNPQGISSYLSYKRVLRMAIYLTDGVDSFIPYGLSSKSHRYLRSLLFFPRHGHEAEQDKYQQWMKCICIDFQGLRVLDLEGLSLRGRLTRQVKNLIHLRYLSLKETKVSELPSCIGSLRFLQILDLRVSHQTDTFIKIPSSLRKLDQLRQLLLPSISYEITGSELLCVDTLICLETLENVEIRNFRFKDLLKLESLLRLSVKDIVSEEETLNIILQSPALKSGRLQSCSLGVKGNVISDNPCILSSLDCTHRLRMVEQIRARTKDVIFPRSLRVLHLESCKLEDDPMGILGSLHHLKVLFLGMDSFVGSEMKCGAKSFPKLKTFNLEGLMNLEDWKAREGSMSKLNKLMIRNCRNLKSIPEALPSLVHVTCSPCVSGTEKYNTCICHKAKSFSAPSYQKHFIKLFDYKSWLLNPLVGDVFEKVVLWGEGGVGKTTSIKVLHQIHRYFDAVAWAFIPTSTCSSTTTTTLPRGILKGLLRDLDPEITREDLSQMSSDKSTAEIQRVMRQNKCLVILINLEHVDLEYLDKTFGRDGFDKGSKLLITSSKEPTTNCDQVFVRELHTPAFHQTWHLFDNRLPAATALQNYVVQPNEVVSKRMRMG